jgi:hypothetical protein
MIDPDLQRPGDATSSFSNIGAGQSKPVVDQEDPGKYLSSKGVE